MKTILLLIALLILSKFTIARADQTPVGSSSVSIRAESLIIQEEISKDLATPLVSTTLPKEEETWSQVAKIQNMLESIPSMKKDF